METARLCYYCKATTSCTAVPVLTPDLSLGTWYFCPRCFDLLSVGFLQTTPMDVLSAYLSGSGQRLTSNQVDDCLQAGVRATVREQIRTRYFQQQHANLARVRMRTPLPVQDGQEIPVPEDAEPC